MKPAARCPIKSSHLFQSWLPGLLKEDQICPSEMSPPLAWRQNFLENWIFEELEEFFREKKKNKEALRVSLKRFYFCDCVLLLCFVASNYISKIFLEELIERDMIGKCCIHIYMVYKSLLIIGSSQQETIRLFFQI